MIKYSALRGRWDDDLIFSFQNLDKPTSFKDNVITMDIWEEGIVSLYEYYYYYHSLAKKGLWAVHLTLCSNWEANPGGGGGRGDIPAISIVYYYALKAMQIVCDIMS